MIIVHLGAGPLDVSCQYEDTDPAMSETGAHQVVDDVSVVTCERCLSTRLLGAGKAEFMAIQARLRQLTAATR